MTINYHLFLFNCFEIQSTFTNIKLNHYVHQSVLDQSFPGKRPGTKS